MTGARRQWRINGRTLLLERGVRANKVQRKSGVTGGIGDDSNATNDLFEM